VVLELERHQRLLVSRSGGQGMVGLLAQQAGIAGAGGLALLELPLAVALEIQPLGQQLHRGAGQGGVGHLQRLSGAAGVEEGPGGGQAGRGHPLVGRVQLEELVVGGGGGGKLLLAIGQVGQLEPALGGHARRGSGAGGLLVERTQHARGGPAPHLGLGEAQAGVAEERRVGEAGDHAAVGLGRLVDQVHLGLAVALPVERGGEQVGRRLGLNQGAEVIHRLQVAAAGRVQLGAAKGGAMGEGAGRKLLGHPPIQRGRLVLAAQLALAFGSAVQKDIELGGRGLIGQQRQVFLKRKVMQAAGIEAIGELLAVGRSHGPHGRSRQEQE
jgi:hypothetical protein